MDNSTNRKEDCIPLSIYSMADNGNFKKPLSHIVNGSNNDIINNLSLDTNNDKKRNIIIDNNSLHSNNRKKRRNRKVLSEEKYFSLLSSILKKSYFPELEKLKTQLFHLNKSDSIDKDQLEKILSFNPSSSTFNSRSNLFSSTMTLEQFQSLYTNEDDKSYETLIDNINKIRENQRNKFFKNQYLANSDSNNHLLFLKSSHSPISSILPSSSNLLTGKDEINGKSNISLKNTRFPKSKLHSLEYDNGNIKYDHDDEIDRFSELERMASQSDDNLSLIINNRNIGNNRNFVPTTPIINPNIPDNNIITWGHLKSTPTRLDTGNSILSSSSLSSNNQRSGNHYHSNSSPFITNNKRGLLKNLLKKRLDDNIDSFDISIGGKNVSDKITTPLIIRGGDRSHHHQGRHHGAASTSINRINSIDHTPKRQSDKKKN